MTKEELEMIPGLIEALNNLSCDKIYKSTGAVIQMRPKVSHDGNGWGDISIEEILVDMAQDIETMQANIKIGIEKYVEYRKLRQSIEQAAIDKMSVCNIDEVTIIKTAQDPPVEFCESTIKAR